MQSHGGNSEMAKQHVIREGHFDAAHRVMNERVKCFNLHGHTYHYALHFSYTNIKEIGYAMDFKEIKRVGMQWIDDYLDHAVIVNPEDISVIYCANKINSKIWKMGLNGDNYCNPTAENIAKEIMLAMQYLFPYDATTGFRIDRVILKETPSCSVSVVYDSTTSEERDAWRLKYADEVMKYAERKGLIKYDDREK